MVKTMTARVIIPNKLPKGFFAGFKLIIVIILLVLDYISG